MNDNDLGPLEPLDPLNQSAFSALRGILGDWRTPLVQLLRSDTPINSAVRHELADTIEKTASTGITLNLAGHIRIQKRVAGLEARRGWFSDGLAVAAYVPAAENIADAFATASHMLNKDEDRCRKTYYYYINCIQWSNRARETGFWYKNMDDSDLQEIWHFASFDQNEDFKPVPPSGQEYDEVRFARIEFFKNLFVGQPRMKQMVDLFVRLCEISPPGTP